MKHKKQRNYILLNICLQGVLSVCVCVMLHVCTVYVWCYDARCEHGIYADIYNFPAVKGHHSGQQPTIKQPYNTQIL